MELTSSPRSQPIRGVLRPGYLWPILLTRVAETNLQPGVFPLTGFPYEHAWGEVTNAVFFQFCPLLDRWSDLFLLSEPIIVCYT